MTTALPLLSRRLLAIAPLVPLALLAHASSVVHGQTATPSETAPAALEPVDATRGEPGFLFRPIAVERLGGSLTADVNDDGILDLIESGSPAFRIRLGYGNGNFRAPRGFEPGGRVTSLADFDGDGDLDVLALGPSGTRRLHVYLNRGDGTFPTWRTAFFNASARTTAAADWDGDGDVDIAVQYGVTARLVFLWNDGNANFSGPTNNSYGRFWELNVVDIDADGDPDIVGGASYRVNVLVNDGGTFSLQTVTTGASWGRTSVADLDGDGTLDVVAGGLGLSLEIVRGDGAGGFEAPVSIPTGSSLNLTFSDLVHAFDADGDGDADVAALVGEDRSNANAPETESLVLFRNDGAGGFARAHTLLSVGPGELIYVDSADLDRDGDVDLVLQGKPRTILLNNGDGTFGRFESPVSRFTLNRPRESWSVPTGDVDGDGDADLVVPTFGARNDRVTTYFNDGDGIPDPQPAGQIRSRHNELADMNGDGILDLVGANNGISPARLVLSLGDGTGRFDPPTNRALTPDVTGLVVRDLDGDGERDVAVCGERNDEILVLFGDGAGSLSTPVPHATAAAPGWLAAGDLDADGDVDLVTVHASLDQIAVLWNDGAGGFPGFTTFATGASPRMVEIADLDADGDLDAVSANAFPGTLSVLRNPGNGIFDQTATLETIRGVLFVRAADLDGDSLIDLIGATDGIAVHRGRGDGRFGRPRHYATPGLARAIALVDFDADSDLDVAVLSEDMRQRPITVLENLSVSD